MAHDRSDDVHVFHALKFELHFVMDVDQTPSGSVNGRLGNRFHVELFRPPKTSNSINTVRKPVL